MTQVQQTEDIKMAWLEIAIKKSTLKNCLYKTWNSQDWKMAGKNSNWSEK